MKGCLDPLLLQWLNYRVSYRHKFHRALSIRSESATAQQQPPSATESAVSEQLAAKKKTFPSLHQSVHSSSDKEKRKAEAATKKSSVVRTNDSDKFTTLINDPQEAQQVPMY